MLWTSRGTNRWEVGLPGISYRGDLAYMMKLCSYRFCWWWWSSSTDDRIKWVRQAAAASAWEDSLHVLQEMLLLQQQQQQQLQNQQQHQHMYQSDQVISQSYNLPAADHHLSRTAGSQSISAGHNNNNIISNGSKYPGESDLLNLLQLPRSAAISNSPYATINSGRSKGPLYSTSTISGPVNTGNIMYDSAAGIRCSSHVNPNLHSQQNNLHSFSLSAASFFHSLPQGAGGGGDTQEGSNSTHGMTCRQVPLLVDLDQDRDELMDGCKTSTSLFGSKRGGGDHAAGSSLGKSGEPRGVNHFATERQRREFLNEKYQTLRSLVPNPTKVTIRLLFVSSSLYVSGCLPAQCHFRMQVTSAECWGSVDTYLMFFQC